MFISFCHIIFVYKDIREQSKAENADRKHGDKQESACKVEWLTDAVEHDQSRKRDEINGDLGIVLIEKFGMEIREYRSALHG